MSSPFNYDIDERHLRSKLREMTRPLDQEAWRSFEAHLESKKHQHKSRNIPEFNLNLNRNILIPVALGLVVIGLSVLLFKVINISDKKPAPETETIAMVNTNTVVSVPEKTMAPTIDSTLIKARQDSVLHAKRIQDSLASVAATTVAVTNTNTVTPTVQPVSGDRWTTMESTEIYQDPNIRSNVIGRSAGKKDYSAIEEKIYFIKVAFEKDGKTEYGYIRKQFLLKNGRPVFDQGATAQPPRKRKAEVMEGGKAPSLLPGGNTEEPELK